MTFWIDGAGAGADCFSGSGKPAGSGSRKTADSGSGKPKCKSLSTCWVTIGEFGYCGGKGVNPEAEATFNFTDNWGFCLESKVTVKKKPKGNFSLI